MAFSLGHVKHYLEISLTVDKLECDYFSVQRGKQA